MDAVVPRLESTTAAYASARSRANLRTRFTMARKKVITIPYKPYPHQTQIHEMCSNHRFACVVAARRSGKTVAAINHLIARALSASDGKSRYAYIAPTYRQAKRIAFDYCKEFTATIPLIKYHTTELAVNFPNGSRLQLYGIDSADSLRGSYFDAVVLDEYGMFPTGGFDKVIRPALADRQGSCLFTGTPNGRANDFYEKWCYAGEDSNDWARLHINWKDAGVLKKHEVMAMKAGMSDEEFSQELEGTFTSAVRGSYFSQDMNKAQDEGRITTVPYEPKLPVHSFWDLGVNDATSIWCVQFVGNEIRCIEYIEDSGKGLDYYIRQLQDREYIWGEHYAPFDIQVREMSTGMSRLEIAAQLGIHFNVVQRMGIQDGINAIRSIFNRLWFDKTACDQGIQCLWNYRRDYDDRAGQFKPKPVHDWSSHGADAMRYLALSVENITNTAGIVSGKSRPRVFSTLH